MKFEHKGHTIALNARGQFEITVRDKLHRCASLDAAKKRIDDALAEAAAEKPPVRGFSIGYQGSLREASILRTVTEKRRGGWADRVSLLVEWVENPPRRTETNETFFTHDDPKVVKAAMKKLKALKDERTRVLRELRKQYDAALAELDAITPQTFADYHDGKRAKFDPVQHLRGSSRDDLP